MKLTNLFEQEITLSSTEKFLLVVMYTSQTPVLAFDRIRDSQRNVVASNMLQRYGFITLGDGQAQLTQKGKQALEYYGLVDETGDVTDMGQKLVDDYEEK